MNTSRTTNRGPSSHGAPSRSTCMTTSRAPGRGPSSHGAPSVTTTADLGSICRSAAGTLTTDCGSACGTASAGFGSSVTRSAMGASGTEEISATTKSTIAATRSSDSGSTTDTTGATVSEEQPPVTAVSASSPTATSATGAAVSEQTRRAPGATGNTLGSRLGEPGTAVTEEDPASATIGVGSSSVHTVTNEWPIEQRHRRSIDTAKNVLLNCLKQRSTACLRRHVSATASGQRVDKRFMEGLPLRR